MKTILLSLITLFFLSSCSEDSDNPVTVVPASTEYNMSLKIGDERKYSIQLFQAGKSDEPHTYIHKIISNRKYVYKDDSVTLCIIDQDDTSEKGYFTHEGVYYHFSCDKTDDTLPIPTEYLFKEQMKLGDILIQLPTGERLEVTADKQMIKVGNTTFNCVKIETFNDEPKANRRTIYVADKIGMVKLIRERYNEESKQYEVSQTAELIEHNI